MLLKDKNVVIYGAGGAVGGAFARVFAHEGARVFLAGRRLEPLNVLANEIIGAGGMAETAQVDALNLQSVENHLNDIVAKVGRIDITFNAISLGDAQGELLVDMSLGKFVVPIETAMKTQFITAAARHMIKRKSGVILALTANVARMSVPYVGGFGVACAAIESLCRQLAGELGQHGIRVVCLRSAGSPDAPGVREAFKLRAQEQGITFDEFLTSITSDIPLRKLPLLAEVANVAAFMASDMASGVTGEVANLTSGALMD